MPAVQSAAVAENPKKQGIDNLKRGGTRGAKWKRTVLKEQIAARTLKTVNNQDVTPLDVMLRAMNIAVQEHEQAIATPVPSTDKGREAHEKRIRNTLKNAVEVAVCAAPYCHSKLQTIDKTVKKGVVIKVISFKDAPDLEPAPVLTITKDVG